MCRLALALFSVVAFSQIAVAADPAPKATGKALVGKWNLDVDGTVEQMKAAAKTDEEKAGVEIAKGFIAVMKMSMEFKGDGKMTFSMSSPMGAEKKEGKYVIKSEKKSTLVVDGTIDGKTKEVTIKFTDKNTIEMHVPEDGGLGVMVLKRAKAQ